MPLLSFNFRFISWVLLFHVVTFLTTIVLCYSCQSVALNFFVISPRIWVVIQIMVKVLLTIVIASVLNQSYDHCFEPKLWSLAP
jgi:hypothetical protein